MKRFITILYLMSIFTVSFSQTWTAIPFSLGSDTGSFTICGGAITVTVTDSFNSTFASGMVGLNGSGDDFGSISFSTPLDIRIDDTEFTGSNNGDSITVETPAGVSWTSYGAEASVSGTDLELILNSVPTRSGGETTDTVSTLNFYKLDGGGGGVRVYFDSDVCPVLPIELLSFNAELINDDQVKLDWQTVTEINNDYFTLERLKDNENWEEVSQIEGAGNSSSLLSYSTVDENPYYGTSYYRLKQTDFNGQFDYSELKSIETKRDINLKVGPNPTYDFITLVGEKSELEESVVYNSYGQDVTLFTSKKNRSASEMLVDMSKLESGIYIVKTKNTMTRIVKK